MGARLLTDHFPQRLLIFDLETTGLAPPHEVIEVGAILFSVPERSVIYQFSSVLFASENPASNVNRISKALLQEVFYLPDLAQLVMPTLERMATYADAIVGHNISFDLQWCDGIHLPQFKLPVIDSMDMPFPQASRIGGNLVSLALEHGIGVVEAHRALTDCQLLARLFASQPDLESLLSYALLPKVWVEARIDRDQNDRVKQYGFRWNRPEAPRCWSRLMPKGGIPDLPFPACLLRPRIPVVADNLDYDKRHLAKERGFQWDPLTKRWAGMVLPEDLDNLPFQVQLLSTD